MLLLFWILIGVGGFAPGCHCDEALGNDCRFAMNCAGGGAEWWNELAAAADDEDEMRRFTSCEHPAK